MGLPPPSDKNFLARVREQVLVWAGLAGDPMDAVPTLRELKKAGLINVRQSPIGAGATSGGSGGGGSRPRPVVEPAVDLTPPPPPGGFAAVAGITQILFETAAPVYRQGHGHARTKIYAAPWVGGPLPTFAAAVLYTDFPGNIGVAPFDPASDLRLWATWTSVDGQESEPAGGTNGIAATTGLLEDQHIANLAVGKLLAGSLDVGQYIQSADYVAGTTGWRIQTLPGGGAFLEINGGAIIGGLQVFADHIQSTNYVLNTQGYRLNSNGTGQIGGFVLETAAIKSSNYIAGVQGWRLAADGTGQLRVATLDAISANLGTVTAGVLRNASDTVHMDLNVAAAGLLFRAGASHNYGPYAGTHYAVEIYEDGNVFIGKNLTSGGSLLASGSSYAIPDMDRPAVIFAAGPDVGPIGGGP